MRRGPLPVEPASALRGLFTELSDLKRIRSAGRVGSIAERGFLSAWAALAAGERSRDVMHASVASALASARLGDMDRRKLVEAGLSEGDAHAVLRRAVDDVASPLDTVLFDTLRSGLAMELKTGDPPDVALALAAQPRAGATCPGKPRLIFEPPENHAEHCWVVALYGTLLSCRYGADPTRVFLAGLSHHLHNAILPDSGFTGERLLGEHLEPACAAATASALDTLCEPLRGEIVAARTILVDASTPDGRAFHAADVVDRVMQIEQHLRPASLTMRALLDDWQLVHAGPVKGFQDTVLAEVGLA